MYGIITQGKHTRRHAEKGVLKINDLKDIKSQLMSATTVTAAAGADQLCYHLIAYLQSATDLL